MDDREKMRFQKENFVRTSRATLWLTGETSWGVKFDWGEKLTVGQFTGKKSWLVRKVYWWESTLVRKVDWSFYHQLALCFQYKRDSGVDLFLKNDRTSAHIFPHLFGPKLSITSKNFGNCLQSIWVLKLSVLKRTDKRIFIHPCTHFYYFFKASGSKEAFWETSAPFHFQVYELEKGG